MTRFLFTKLAKLYEQLEPVTSGNRIRQLISDFLKTVPKGDIEAVAYMTLGQIASEYENINIGVAEKMVLRAVSDASKQKLDYVISLYKNLGDAGLVAEKLVGRKKKDLTLNEVFTSLHKIAKASGEGSQETKIKILSQILEHASQLEARYISRIILGTLRLGVGDMTLLDSLAIAFTGSKEAKKELQRAYNICPDIGIIAKTIVYKGLRGIRNIKTVIGRPILSMLAQRVQDFEMLKNKIQGKLAAEEKYDGERVQVHKKGKKVLLYSRRLENITNEFPDIVENIKKNVRARDCIIEGECVAVDDKGNLLPFQVVMQRKRKHNIEQYIKKIPICLYIFDILNLNGKSYLNKKYPIRRQILEKIIKETKQLQLAKRVVSYELDEIEDFFNATVQRGGEGIIVKSCTNDSFYTPGKRGWLWIKWKKEYAKKLADTFDLVVIGAFKGKGKRSATYGALLCAAYNPSIDKFETVCKLGSGFTDKQLEELPKRFKKYEIKKQPARVVVKKNLIPDVWFAPAIVVEIIGAEITRSPIHTCAMKEGKGLALRFPRFLRYRTEKKPEQATTGKELIGLLRNHR